MRAAASRSAHPHEESAPDHLCNLSSPPRQRAQGAGRTNNGVCKAVGIVLHPDETDDNPSSAIRVLRHVPEAVIVRPESGPSNFPDSLSVSDTR